MMIATTACETSSRDSGKMMTRNQMTEDALLAQLSPEGKQAFLSMDAEGRQLALTLANQSCSGKNGCKGLNSCKTDKNACMGLGGCKGTSKGPFADKNDSVKVAAKHMAEKRNAMMNK